MGWEPFLPDVVLPSIQTKIRIIIDASIPDQHGWRLFSSQRIEDSPVPGE